MRLELRGVCSCFTSAGPHDFRWVSGGYFVLRLLMLIPFAASVNAMVHLTIQMLIACAAAGFFIICKPYGAHLRRNNNRRPSDRQQLSNLSANFESSFNRRIVKHEWYNQLDAAVFVLLAAVIGISLYQYYLSLTDAGSPVWALLVQTLLLFLPAGWFGCFAVYGIQANIKNWWKNDRARSGSLAGSRNHEEAPLVEEEEDSEDSEEEN